MLDGLGRKIDYARISITEKCNLRCLYCMPRSGDTKTAGRPVLSYAEILRVCRILAQQGICKLKITGGEPLVREGVASLIGQLKALPGISHVTLTTNGVCLKAQVKDLAAAGLDGINISLDTLNPERYRDLTMRGSVRDVLSGLACAIETGIPAIKINCVPIAGISEEDVVELAALAQDQVLHVRFIEMMPIGLGKGFSGMDPLRIQEMLRQAYGELRPFEEKLGNGPARYYSLPGFRGKIGFISAVSECFCQECNRIRLTSDGTLKTCLHVDEGTNLVPLLNSNDDELLADQIVRAIRNKPTQHNFSFKQALRADQRIMSQIGG